MIMERLGVPGSLSPDTVAPFAQALSSLRPRPLLLAGNAEVFCSGIDLAAMVTSGPEEVETFATLFATCLAKIHDHPAPTVAYVRGVALGGGVGLSAACDVVIAHPDARFGIPECLYGFIPGLILPYLKTRMSDQAIRRMAFFGLSIDPEEGRRIALVDEICADPEEKVCRRLGLLLGRPASAAVSALRELLDHEPGSGRHEWLAACRSRSLQLMRAASVRDGLARYLETATPPWEQES